MEVTTRAVLPYGLSVQALARLLAQEQLTEQPETFTVFAHPRHDTLLTRSRHQARFMCPLPYASC